MEPVEIDMTVASAARVYDYLLGGTDNFEIDREVAERSGVAIGGMGHARAAVRGNRLFLKAAVEYLTTDAGIRQFLDIGSGLPNMENVHEVAQRIAPESRIVYVDNDPVALAHSHRWLEASAPEGVTDYLQADFFEPERVVEGAAKTLDLTQPVALMLVSMLHFFRDELDPQGLVARFMDAMPSGSYLVISHLTADLVPEMVAVAESPGDDAEYEFILRTRDELAAFFQGLELVGPGVTSIADWLPSDTPGPQRQWADTFYGAIGRKP
jgi:hypothetical protein